MKKEKPNQDRWSKDFRLLLIYKDPISEDKISGSPLVSFSRTIGLHYLYAHRDSDPQKFGLNWADIHENAGVESNTENQQHLFPEPLGNKRCDRPIPNQCSVWGWWRKPWETHHNLFAKLQAALSQKKRPVVFLYNQYLQRLFQAKLHDLYFEPNLTSVIIPSSWKLNCPPYYRHTQHLCGAFFVLDIDHHDRDSKELNQFFIDSSSFELNRQQTPMVVPPPEEMISTCRAMVDMPPIRSKLRTCENTVLFLRKYKQHERTSELLNSETSSETELVEAFQETSWRDLLAVLSNASPSAWSKLNGLENALCELGAKAKESSSVITRFDFELFAGACSNVRFQQVIIDNGSTGIEFNALGFAIRRWVTSCSQDDTRFAASNVFKQAWGSAMKSYNLSKLPDSYFERLPAIEAVACAIKHDIGKKFYRDHLNHNVRAALLTSHLASSINDNAGLNYCRIGFFSGLFHDIAMPLTTFPDTVGNLAKALAVAQPSHDGRINEPRRIQGLLDRESLRRSLSYVALLASIPNITTAFAKEAFVPWANPESALRMTNNRILFEELLCAGSEEHALISAAVMFAYAVQGISKDTNVDYDTAFRTLLGTIASPSAKPHGRELAAILQCMALHDRRPAAEHHGVLDPPRDTPVPLSCAEFRMPATLCIADELQEWGRTLGPFEKVGATDGNVKFSSDSVEAKFDLSEDAKIFASVPFSLFEFIVGKFRTLGRFKHEDKLGNPRPISLKMSLSKLSAFHLHFVSAGEVVRIAFESGFHSMSFKATNGDPALSAEIQGSKGDYLAKIVAGSPERGRDYVLFRGDPAACETFVSACKDPATLSEVSIDGKHLELLCSDGRRFVGEIETYRFGASLPRCTPADDFPREGPISMIQIRFASILSPPLIVAAKSLSFHLSPHPHFLDFDWRFTVKTCRAILDFARHQARMLNDKICYLGCPTLALWHHQYFPDESNWDLLDRGHYALNLWVKDDEVPKGEFISYDVFNALKPNLMHKYAIVITDPPWYDPQYKIFCVRARELVKPGGVIGVTHYPKFDDRKYDEFQKIIFGGIMCELQEFGAMEIDYEVPEFERASGLHIDYEHRGLGIYRPGYIDFYQAPDDDLKDLSKDEPSVPALLPYSIPLTDGHHLRCVQKESLERALSERRFRISRRASIKRIENLSPNWVAWSSRNAIVKVSDSGQKIKSEDELIQFVQDAEANQKIHIEND